MGRRTILACCCLAFVFRVHAADDIVCPDGTRPNGETTPEVREAWCELNHEGTVVQHGPYRAWWPNGVLGTSGQFLLGKAVGEWKGWFPSGKPQGEEWFEDGRLVRARYWNEDGESVAEPVSPKESQSDQ